jgi:hypothetical protein
MGGGCFWCTEAVFQQVPAVLKVRQFPPSHPLGEMMIPSGCAYMLAKYIPTRECMHACIHTKAYTDRQVMFGYACSSAEKPPNFTNHSNNNHVQILHTYIGTLSRHLSSELLVLPAMRPNLQSYTY